MDDGRCTTRMSRTMETPASFLTLDTCSSASFMPSAACASSSCFESLLPLSLPLPLAPVPLAHVPTTGAAGAFVFAALSCGVVAIWLFRRDRRRSKRRLHRII